MKELPEALQSTTVMRTEEGGYEVTFPNGFRTELHGNVLKLTMERWRPSHGQTYWYVSLYGDRMKFYIDYDEYTHEYSVEDTVRDLYSQGNLFRSREEAERFCDDLNNTLEPVLKKYNI